VTVSRDFSTVEAAAVVDGRITAIGTSAAINAHRDKNTEIIDLEGRTMTPGLVDSHAHLATLATRELFQVDLTYPGTKSIDDLIARVRTAADCTPEGNWIQGGGWSEISLPLGRYPTRGDLDSATPRHPVMLTHLTGHFAVVNSLALRLAGITRDSPDPVGGSIARDAMTGEPTGMLTELPAIRLFQPYIPPLASTDWDQAIAYGTRRWLEEGVTAIKDNYVRAQYDEIVAAFQRLAVKRELRLRPYLMCQAESPDDVELVAKTSPTKWTLAGSGFPKLGGVKVFMDGSLVARTAWMNRPYRESDSYGYPAMDLSHLTSIVKAANRSGLQIGVHAIGDRAVDTVLDAYEAMGMRPKPTRRFSIMHALLPSPSAVQRMRAMDIVIETQSALMPCLASGYARAIEPSRLRRLLPLRTLFSAGLTVANGSDSPTTPVGPRYGMWSARARPGGLYGSGASPYGVAERIGAFDALRMYTEMGARAMELDEHIGSIEVGKFADFVVWDRDLLAVPDGEMREARPLMTIVNGRIEFQASSGERIQ
jgi:hypothetical protein